MRTFQLTWFYLLVCLICTNLASAQLPLLHQSPKQEFLLTEKPDVTDQTHVVAGSVIDSLNFVFDSLSNITPIKGLNAALLLPDGSTWQRAAGLAAEIPVISHLTPNHLMGMGSISKSFVSATLLLLYEDGLIALDDSIGKFVGPYSNISGKITIRQLLSHRSGLNDYINENPLMVQAYFENTDSIWQADTILHHYVLAPNFQPGDDWSYSNTNYLLAGQIIEKITGQAWYQVVRQRVIDPLNLTNTFIFPWESPGAIPFSHVFSDLDDNSTVEDLQGYGLTVEGLFSLAGSAGCLISNPKDLVRFSERLYGGHLLQPATLAEMETDYIQNSASGFMYGLGTSSFPAPLGLENWGHDGSLIYNSIALYFPEKNISIAVQQNDDRLYDPNNFPFADAFVVFGALLNTYLAFDQPSDSDEAKLEFTSIGISPNPANDAVRLVFPDLAAVSFPVPCAITGFAGNTIALQTLEHKDDLLDIAKLPVGIYQVRAGTFYGKLVVVR